MKNISAESVKEFLLLRYADQVAARGLKPANVPDNFDLLTEGIIDSMGMIEMISAVEQHVGYELDLEGLEADRLTQIGPLSAYVAQQAPKLPSI